MALQHPATEAQTPAALPAPVAAAEQDVMHSSPNRHRYSAILKAIDDRNLPHLSISPNGRDAVKATRELLSLLSSTPADEHDKLLQTLQSFENEIPVMVLAAQEFTQEFAFSEEDVSSLADAAAVLCKAVPNFREEICSEFQSASFYVSWPDEGEKESTEASFSQLALFIGALATRMADACLLTRVLKTLLSSGSAILHIAACRILLGAEAQGMLHHNEHGFLRSSLVNLRSVALKQHEELQKQGAAYVAEAHPTQAPPLLHCGSPPSPGTDATAASASPKSSPSAAASRPSPLPFYERGARNMFNVFDKAQLDSHLFARGQVQDPQPGQLPCKWWDDAMRHNQVGAIGYAFKDGDDEKLRSTFLAAYLSAARWAPSYPSSRESKAKAGSSEAARAMEVARVRTALLALVCSFAHPDAVGEKPLTLDALRRILVSVAVPPYFQPPSTQTIGHYCTGLLKSALPLPETFLKCLTSDDLVTSEDLVASLREMMKDPVKRMWSFGDAPGMPLAVFTRNHLSETNRSRVELAITADGYGRAVKTVLLHEAALREAEMLSQQRGDRICKCYGNWKESGQHKLVLELLDCTLEQKITQMKCDGKEFSPLELQQLARDLVRAVKQLHDSSQGRPVLHRDIKPRNVMLELRGDGVLHLKLIDLDLSRSADSTGGGLHAPTLGAGTKGWMAPELRVARERTHGIAADMFSVGLVLFYMRTNGCHAFQRKLDEPLSDGKLQSNIDAAMESDDDSDDDDSDDDCVRPKNLLKEMCLGERPMRRELLSGLDKIIVNLLRVNPAERCVAVNNSWLWPASVWNEVATHLYSACKACNNHDKFHPCDFQSLLDKLLLKCTNFAKSWADCKLDLCSPFSALCGSGKPYPKPPDYKNPRGFIFAVRNLFHHWHELDHRLPTGMRKQEHLAMWLEKKFPCVLNALLDFCRKAPKVRETSADWCDKNLAAKLRAMAKQQMVREYLG